MAHTIDGQAMGHSWPCTLEDLKDAKYFKEVELVYGADTWESCRYPRTKDLPLTLHFIDALAHRHEVTISKADDVLTLVIPCGFEIDWFSEGETRDRTTLSGRCNLAVCTFTYCWSLLPCVHHGIRVHIQGGYASNITPKAWENVLRNALKESAKNRALMLKAQKGRTPSCFPCLG
mmetsp:Transcript_65289/g.142199  ORF Transcript_65289/g.142199 Transcript_65289/m.142199 type:complete len:176 (-) Transcript_65289:159-686(-)